MAPVSAHLDVEGSDSCSGETVTKEDCLLAVQQLLPEGATQETATLNDGSWAHVPQGCSMNHGNYRALWNSQTDAISNTGSWTPVCIGDERATTTTTTTTTTTMAPVSAHLDVEGSDSCSGETVTKEVCLQAVQQLLPEGATQETPTLNDGSWAHVPQGCSMNHGNYRALWNSQTGAISN